MKQQYKGINALTDIYTDQIVGKMKFTYNWIGTRGTELIALTTIEETQIATIAPPPYNRTVDLLSRASHYRDKDNYTMNKIILLYNLFYCI